MSLKILSCNANGLAETYKRKKLFNYLRDNKIDVAFVPETHGTKGKIRLWANEWGGKIKASNFNSKAHGVAILFRRNLDIQILHTKTDHQGRIIMTKIQLNDQSVLLVNVYTPNEDDPEFFIDLFNQVNAEQVDHYVIGGDFNKVMNPEIDRKSISSRKYILPEASKVLNEQVSLNNWIDVWRLGHSDVEQFTWKRRKPITFSRLDYFLLPSFDVGSVQECEIWANNISDHSFVYIELAFEKIRRGKGLWKFNNSLLVNSDFVAQMNKHIEESLKNANEDPSIRWESLKIEITEFSKWFAKKNATYIKKKWAQLSDQLAKLEKRLDRINLKSSRAIHFITQINEKIDRVKIQMEEISRHRIQGAMLRTKVRWAQEAGHNSSYFLRLEKSRAKSKTMTAIRLESRISRNVQEILQAQKQFYEELYTIDIQVKFQEVKVQIPQISKQQKKTLDSKLTKEELTATLKQSKRNKTPGPDGIPADFYMVFWRLLGDPLFEAISDSIEKNKLFVSVRRGVITLIPKKTKDPLLVCN